MSGPNHRYTHRWFQFGDMARQEKDDVRWTRTSGEEWDALIERARKAVMPIPALAPEQIEAEDGIALNALVRASTGVLARDVLRDILAYFGERA